MILCQNCHQHAAHNQGRCDNCHNYHRDTGRERPPRLWKPPTCDHLDGEGPDAVVWVEYTTPAECLVHNGHDRTNQIPLCAEHWAEWQRVEGLGYRWAWIGERVPA